MESEDGGSTVPHGTTTQTATLLQRLVYAQWYSGLMPRARPRSVVPYQELVGPTSSLSITCDVRAQTEECNKLMVGLAALPAFRLNW